MDAIAAYNLARWEALGRSQAVWTRPWLDLDAAGARERVDPEHLLGDLAGKSVLCLASGGGQQSAAFALLGARVTVVDLSPSQLAQDAAAARHHGLTIRTAHADMRDLSALDPDAFDVVCHPYSINFVPDAAAVFGQVARVIRPSGMYHLMTANPFLAGLGTHAWTGRGYELTEPYVDGAEVTYRDEAWVRRDGELPVDPPRGYRHTLSTLLNGLVDHGFTLERVREYARSPDGASPWLLFWAIWDRRQG